MDVAQDDPAEFYYGPKAQHNIGATWHDYTITTSVSHVEQAASSAVYSLVLSRNYDPNTQLIVCRRRQGYEQQLICHTTLILTASRFKLIL